MFSKLYRGFSLLGILISMACIVVLMSIYMSTVQKAVTGGKGQSTQGSVWGMQDQIQLQLLGKALTIDAMTNSNQFLTPSVLSRSNDVYDNTSANFWSAMLVQNLAKPEQLVSPNDNGWVEPATVDYRERNWDLNFSTDLTSTFNVSYAHMPVWGQRLDRRWKPQGGKFPILGNRGPKDGIEGTTSITLDADGIWRGWVLFADGSISWTEGTSITSKWRRHDGVIQDTIFLDEADSADDAILGFTLEMDDYGPTYVWD
jgi:type II secretory pathway pseudopilin PulG